MAHPKRQRIAITAVCAFAAAASVAAVDGKVATLRATAGRVRAAIEVTDVFGAAQRAVLERGGTLHVRVQAGVWEDRSVFDRAVEAPQVTVFRIIRDPEGAAIAVIGPDGSLVTYKPYPGRLPLEVDACALDRIDAGLKYYLDGTVTIGSLGEDELDDAGQAVFGRDDGPAGIKRMGKFLLNSVLQVKDYVDSVSTDVRSARFTRKTLRQ